jgi:tetratricopeptide (TPR) repeat protein
MDPMGQGDRHTVTYSARRTRRAGAGLALLTSALVGCGDGGSASRHDLPPQSHPWLSAQGAPGPEAWVSVDPWLPPAPSAAPYGGLSSVETTAIPVASAAESFQYTPQAMNPALLGSPTSLPTVPEPLGATNAETTPASIATPPAQLATSLLGVGPREITALPAPAAEPTHPATAAAAPAALLAPEPIPAEEPTPAPGDVMVVDEMPTLATPTPAAIAATRRPLEFPAAQAVSTVSVPPATSTAVAPVTPTPASDQAPAAPQSLSAATPTGKVVNERAIAKIRRGYELAERGAYFAARNEFLTSLRMIAEAKDQIHGAPRRTVALANGLRALEEAADFAPTGSAAELDLDVIVASHRTPTGKSLNLEHVLPQQLADAYLNYAEVQLASAVAGEPTGSIALHALGKLNSQLGRTEPETNLQAGARAFALQEAALWARSDNHLAAHELGVLLAESGHYVESDQLLRQVATRAPHAVVYRNLARVERQLGRPDLAQVSERQAAYLASRGADGGAAVAWVSSDALARTPDSMGAGTATANMAAAQPMQLAPGHAGPSQNAPMTARGQANYLR